MTDSKRVGVLIIGSHGAVATTVIAGAALMRKGLAARHGMTTESPLCNVLPLVALDDLVFGGWDLRADSAYDAALEHQVIPIHLLEKIKPDLESFKAWPAVVSSKFLGSMAGKNIVGASTVREELEVIGANIQAFKLRTRPENRAS